MTLGISDVLKTKKHYYLIASSNHFGGVDSLASGFSSRLCQTENTMSIEGRHRRLKEGRGAGGGVRRKSRHCCGAGERLLGRLEQIGERLEEITWPS
jgi:hypothetical protein